ncbi:MAG: hypothetical protein SGPRY_000781, partial [Prymnesium sp.]
AGALSLGGFRSHLSAGRAGRVALSQQADAAQVDYAEVGTNAVDNFIRRLGDDMDPPDAVRELKAAVSEGDVSGIQRGVYEMLIVQALDYQLTEDGMLRKNELDFSDLSVDEEAKKESMRYAFDEWLEMPEVD